MSISFYDAVPGRQYRGRIVREYRRLDLDELQTGELSIDLYDEEGYPYDLVNASGRYPITTSTLIADDAEALLKRRDIGKVEYGCDAMPSPLRSEIRNNPLKFQELLLVYTEEGGRLDKLELFRGELDISGGYTFAIDPTTVTPFERLSFCWIDGKAVDIKNTNICSLPGPSAEEVFADKDSFDEKLWIYYIPRGWPLIELGEIFKAESFVETPMREKVYNFKDYKRRPIGIKYLTFCRLRDRIDKIIPVCPLCLEPVSLIRYVPICGRIHTVSYHRECLSRVRPISRDGPRLCPICRYPFTLTQVRGSHVYALASDPPLPAEVSTLSTAPAAASAAVSPLSTAPTAAASAEVSPVSTAPTAVASAAVPPVSAAPTAAEIGPQSPSALAAAAASARARSRGCFGLGCIGGRSRRSKKYRKQKTKRKLKRRTIRK